MRMRKTPQNETDDKLQDFIFTADATAVDYFSFLFKEIKYIF